MDNAASTPDRNAMDHAIPLEKLEPIHAAVIVAAMIETEPDTAISRPVIDCNTASFTVKMWGQTFRFTARETDA